MVRSKLAWGTLVILGAIVVASASYFYGANAQRTAEDRNLAYVQATLAFAHHKSYENIESLLLRKCYEAALIEARELRTLQLTLLIKNFQATQNDPDLTEYIKTRDPKLFEAVLSGRVPELRPNTTTCP